MLSDDNLQASGSILDSSDLNILDLSSPDKAADIDRRILCNSFLKLLVQGYALYQSKKSSCLSYIRKMFFY